MRKVDRRVYYDIKVLVILSITLIIITLLNVIFNGNFLLRYSILIVCGIYIIIRYRELILSIIKKFTNKIKYERK